MIRSTFFEVRDYICFDGDEIQCVFFLKRGSCGFVLPRYSNIKYIDVDVGATFGLVEIIGNHVLRGVDKSDISLKSKKCGYR